MHRLSCLSALSTFALLLGCDLGSPERYERLTVAAADLQRVTILASAGDLTIEGDPDAVDVAIVAGIHGEHTTIEHVRVGDTLQLTNDCSHWDDCAVDWRVVVPARLAVELETGAGDLRVAGLAASLRASTGAGDIALADMHAPALDVDSGAGDIRGQGLHCEQFRGETGLGDLDLDLAARPRSVWWSSGAGDVALALPGGAYDLDLETGLGDVTLAGVRRDADADAALRLHTGLGDIGIAG
jgi:hypothetical protein